MRVKRGTVHSPVSYVFCTVQLYIQMLDSMGIRSVMVIRICDNLI